MDQLVEEMVTQLGPGPQEVGRTRRDLAGSLRRWGIEGDSADVALLLTSELLTNAVQHGTGPVVVRVGLDRDRTLTVEVRDNKPAELHPQLSSLDAVNGRGLYLVDALADSWGAENGDDGKRVWFSLAQL